MNEPNCQETGGTGPSHRSVEIGVAVFMALLALVGIFGSIKVGIGWGAEGPRAGFFPFYVSLIVVDLLRGQSSVQCSLAPTRRQLFAEWGQLRQVLCGSGADDDLCRAGAVSSASMSRPHC